MRGGPPGRPRGPVLGRNRNGETAGVCLLAQTPLLRGARDGALFVVKTVDDNGQPVQGVFHELRAGRARIGWSSRDDQNLRSIRERIALGQPLSEYQGYAKRCLVFLTRVEVGDYLLYPHQATRGAFSVVQVNGVPDALHREFGRADLSRLFCAELFERMGYSSEVQEGPAEAGSDVVVTLAALSCQAKSGSVCRHSLTKEPSRNGLYGQSWNNCCGPGRKIPSTTVCYLLQDAAARKPEQH